MKTFELPLNPYAETFQVEIGGKSYMMRTHWNNALQRWTMDLGTSNERWMICNMALVAGQNLLMQHDHLKLGFQLWVQMDGKPEEEPGIEGFGKESTLLVVTE